MTSRSKNAVRGYETEIEKSREDSNWKKVVELAQQLKARSPQHGQYYVYNIIYVIIPIIEVFTVVQLPYRCLIL